MRGLGFVGWGGRDRWSRKYLLQDRKVLDINILRIRNKNSLTFRKWTEVLICGFISRGNEQRHSIETEKLQKQREIQYIDYLLDQLNVRWAELCQNMPICNIAMKIRAHIYATLCRRQ